MVADQVFGFFGRRGGPRGRRAATARQVGQISAPSLLENGFLHFPVQTRLTMPGGGVQSSVE
jgi:hypothetical protein